MVGEFKDIIALAGTEPSTDATAISTQHYFASDKIRFVNKRPEKIGGHAAITIDGNSTIRGCDRSIFSYNLSGNVRYLSGTNSNLYHLIGSCLTNITPVVAATTAIANSLDSNFATLGSDPIATVNASTTMTVTDTATRIRVGDTITLSGSSDVNGVPAAQINTTHFIRSQSTNSYTFFVATAATSTGDDGGASVVQATPIVTVNQTAHGFLDGARIKILAAATFAGIPDSDINIEHIIRTIGTNDYDIVVDTTATSSVSGGGGASTTVQGKIASGLCDATAAQGYGAGKYGVGLYGTALVSSSGTQPVRLWSFDRFGNNVIMTPGRQTGVYTWDSIIAAAPALLSNAPTAVNYVYTSNEIVVTLGDSDVGNRRKWSNQGVSTTWTAAATNQAGADDIEGASDFISHLAVKGINLEFTDSQVYTSRYIGRPFVWETKLLDEKSGIISQNARVQHNGIGYWMTNDNFHRYRGGRVEIIPSNSSEEATVKKFVFDDLNTGQKSKIFCWFNKKFNEVQWHYPSAGSNEPDRIVRLNVIEETWSVDTIGRSAGEYPTQLREFPFLAARESDDTTTIYKHEFGKNDSGNALTWSLTLPSFDAGVNTARVLSIIPDSIQTGDITCTVNVKQYPQSSATFGTSTLPVTPTTGRIDFKQNSRIFQYVLSGSAVDQSWRMGLWQHNIAKGGKK